MVHPEIATLVEADEEARASVAAARADAERRIDALRREREARAVERTAAARRSLDDEVRQIVAAAAATVEGRRAQREAWIADKRATADARIDEAAEAWLRICLGGPAGTP